MSKNRTRRSDIVLLSLGDGKSLKAKFIEPEDIDLDKLTYVDIANLPAEIVTMPIAMTKFGLIMNQANHIYNVAKMNLGTYEARKRNDIRANWPDYRPDKSVARTIDSVDDALKLDKGYQKMRKNMYEKLKQKEYMESIYWALKSKDDKVNKLASSMGMQSGDILEAVVNSRLKYINCVELEVVRPLIN